VAEVDFNSVKIEIWDALASGDNISVVTGDSKNTSSSYKYLGTKTTNGGVNVYLFDTKIVIELYAKQTVPYGAYNFRPHVFRKIETINMLTCDWYYIDVICKALTVDPNCVPFEVNIYNFTNKECALNTVDTYPLSQTMQDQYGFSSLSDVKYIQTSLEKLNHNRVLSPFAYKKYKPYLMTIDNINQIKYQALDLYKVGEIVPYNPIPIEKCEVELIFTGTTGYFPFTATAIETDWGDGVIDGSLKHIYAIAGDYHAKTKCIIKAMSFGYYYNNTTPSEIIKKIILFKSKRIKVISFRGCSKLEAVYNGALILPNVTSFAGCFYECKALKTVPYTLFDNSPLATNFDYVFKSSGLISFPNGIFNNVNVKSLNEAFYYMGSMIGNADELWNMSQITSYSKCFFSCLGLSNYDAIPTVWK